MQQMSILRSFASFSVFYTGLLGVCLFTMLPEPAVAQISGSQKISDTAGNLSRTLHNGDRFGTSVASIGDLDGNGVPDVAVGAERDEESVSSSGAVWILLLKSDGTDKNQQQITNGAGGFGGTLEGDEFFGISVTGTGDLNEDTVPDLAVGAARDDDGGSNFSDIGAVWIFS